MEDPSASPSTEPSPEAPPHAPLVDSRVPSDQAVEPAVAASAEGTAVATEVDETTVVTTNEQRLKAMSVVIDAFERKIPIDGRVIGWNKGGFHVSLGGVAAFCPRSQVELGNPKKPGRYLDKDFQFKILEIREEGRRVVVSRSGILEQEREALLAETRKKLVLGAVLEGRVTSLTNFGAFVDLGGIEGLVHLSELSRRRVEHPREVLKKGQEVSVRLTKLEDDGQRISLSIRELEPDPWAAVETRFPAGCEFNGRVLRQSDFGLFVEIEPGIEGLVHTSQLPIGMDMDDPSLAVGQEVNGWVREADSGRQRISLALRPITAADPWSEAMTRYREGSVVEGQVEQIAPFGVFVLLEAGLTGLLPSSQLPRSSQRSAAHSYAVGQQISVQVMSADSKRKRISLALPGTKAEGSRNDYRDYIRKQRTTNGGLNAMAAAFAKLDQNR